MHYREAASKLGHHGDPTSPSAYNTIAGSGHSVDATFVPPWSIIMNVDVLLDLIFDK